MAGRPTKLTPETHKAIVEAIGLGATYATAAACAGVSYDTFNEWMKAGDSATRNNKFSEFSEAVRRAEAECKYKATKVIIKAMADGEWKAALEFLRRRDRAEWGDNIKQELTGKDGGPIDVATMSPSEIAERVAALLATVKHAAP